MATPVEQLATTIGYYLSHEADRQQIANRAYQLATTTLTMQNTVGQMLKEVQRRWR